MADIPLFMLSMVTKSFVEMRVMDKSALFSSSMSAGALKEY